MAGSRVCHQHRNACANSGHVRKCIVSYLQDFTNHTLCSDLCSQCHSPSYNIQSVNKNSNIPTADFAIIQAAIDRIETVVVGDLEDQEYDGSNGCIPAGTVDDMAICFDYDDTIDDDSPGVSA